MTKRPQLAELKGRARRLYIEQALGDAQIATQVSRSERTVYNWRTADQGTDLDWEKGRQARLGGREAATELANKLAVQLAQSISDTLDSISQGGLEHSDLKVILELLTQAENVDPDAKERIEARLPAIALRLPPGEAAKVQARLGDSLGKLAKQIRALTPEVLLEDVITDVLKITGKLLAERSPEAAQHFAEILGEVHTAVLKRKVIWTEG